ncbi:UDP-3-O-acyl-N-acetylglucosamine deacetylase [Membranihabitans maritimus]|uniref:UDP-3-O-acyl-N-acetylglucosamine deacetylase n=1 Tax=Membranihabitans maritimus TaxID=2904244 RepID=UPI001F2A84C4|nr:UDP-3-O-acyl-N-acetylglucosamine deacetylase [Membranihabitans maritimus]
MRKTLSNKFTIEGVGIHTGGVARIEIRPSFIEKGIYFSYQNPDGQLGYIPCHLANVISTNRCTTLGNGERSVSTVEHLMSAFYAENITDAELFIEVGEEIPILDGGSHSFVEKIRIAGIQEFEGEELTKLVIDDIINFICPDTGAEYLLSPNDTLEYEVVVRYDNKVLENQEFNWKMGGDYFNEVSKARTFSMYSEIRGLIEQGLIQGGDLFNAVVLVDTGATEYDVKTFLNQHINNVSDVSVKDNVINGPMFYENEPARHKLLDMIGDLSLLNSNIKGKIQAVRPGHTGNINLARHLIELFYG